MVCPWPQKKRCSSQWLDPRNFSNLNPTTAEGEGGRKDPRLQFEIAATGGLGGPQDYLVNSYLVVARALNPCLERLNHSIARRRLKKADRFRFYQFDSVKFIGLESNILFPVNPVKMLKPCNAA